MNFKGTTNFYNFLSFKKSCYKSVKLYCYYSTQKYDDSLTRHSPFSKREFSKMLCLHNAWEIFRTFSWLYYLYLQIWNWWGLFIYEKFLVYKFKTFKNCIEVKHMIMIIAIIYLFLHLMWYLINSWKLLSENPQASS